MLFMFYNGISTVYLMIVFQYVNQIDLLQIQWTSAIYICIYFFNITKKTSNTTNKLF